MQTGLRGARALLALLIVLALTACATPCARTPAGTGHARQAPPPDVDDDPLWLDHYDDGYPFID